MAGQTTPDNYRNKNNKVMESPKNKTQEQRTKVKNFSAVLAIGLAVLTLFQAGNVKSENAPAVMSTMEAEFISETEAWFASEEMEIEALLLEEAIEEPELHKVFDVNGDLVMEGDPSQNNALRQLVNQAEFMSEFSGNSYYTLTK